MKGMKKVMEDYREKIGNYLDLEIRLMKSVDVDVINEVMNQLETGFIFVEMGEAGQQLPILSVILIKGSVWSRSKNISLSA